MPLATVIRLYSDFAEVALDGAGIAPPEVLTARLRGRLARDRSREQKSALAVGDRAQVTVDESGAIIESTLPRRSKISRRNPQNPRLEQVIAANVDQVLIVASAERPAFDAGLVDHYLVAGGAEGLAAGLCVTKADIAEAGRAEALAAQYRALGVKAFVVTRGDDAAVERLRAGFLAGRVTVLVGQSGAGKTTLRNALLGAARGVAATRDVSAKSGHGRHATTAATFEPLLPQGFLVDTPGIREFGLWRLEPEDVVSHFPEFADAACRFTNCRHGSEPGCGVRALVAAGRATAARLASLRAIADSVRE